MKVIQKKTMIQQSTSIIIADLDRLHKPWPEYTDNDSITNPREIERIFAEHPELRKEYEGMKREYYDLHK